MNDEEHDEFCREIDQWKAWHKDELDNARAFSLFMWAWGFASGLLVSLFFYFGIQKG